AAEGVAGIPCSVLRKSPLLLRDLGLMLQIAERASFSASLSIPTLDEKAWRETEPHTPNPRARLEAGGGGAHPGGERDRGPVPPSQTRKNRPTPANRGGVRGRVAEAGATSVGG